MVTYKKKIYIYIKFLAWFEGYGHPSFEKLFSQSFTEGNVVWAHDMSHSSICYIFYEALYFDSKRTNIIDSIQNRKSTPKTISLSSCNHALQLRISILLHSNLMGPTISFVVKTLYCLPQVRTYLRTSCNSPLIVISFGTILGNLKIIPKVSRKWYLQPTWMKPTKSFMVRWYP